MCIILTLLPEEQAGLSRCAAAALYSQTGGKHGKKSLQSFPDSERIAGPPAVKRPRFFVPRLTAAAEAKKERNGLYRAMRLPARHGTVDYRHVRRAPRDGSFGSAERHCRVPGYRIYGLYGLTAGLLPPAVQPQQPDYFLSAGNTSPICLRASSIISMAASETSWELTADSVLPARIRSINS